MMMLILTMKVVLPRGWTLKNVVNHFIAWMGYTKGTFVKTEKSHDQFKIYIKNKGATARSI